MAGNVAEVQDSVFDAKVIKSEKPVLVDFWATWCAPCKAIAPIVEELSGEYAGKVDFYKLDVDNNRATAAAFGVRGVPTLILFKGGKVVDQMVGAGSKDRMKAMIAKAL
jgi:thioredoxin 1